MKTSVYIATSLDGFIARQDGSLDWLPGSDGEAQEGASEDYGYGAFMASIDVLVMGRNTYELVQSFGAWPYGDKRVVVLTRRGVEIPTEIAATVSQSSSAPNDLVAELAKEGAQHLYIDGGQTIQSFLNANCIDELIITRIPVLIGSGIPLFGPTASDIKLHHVETQSFANGMVQSRYQVLGVRS